MQYSIRIDKQALEYLSSLPQKIKRQIGRKIERLKTDPCPPKCKKLEDGVYRVRSANYRIIYQIEAEVVLVCVLKIGDRKDVYK